MGITAMCPGLFEQTVVSPSHGGSTWNLPLIDPVVSEEKMFKERGRGGTSEPANTVSLPTSLKAQVSYKLHDPKKSQLKVDFLNVCYIQTFDFVTGQFVKLLMPACL